MADLTLKSVHKTYSNGFRAVHGIDLHVKDGEFMVLVGPSGCAKSTTLRMIAGLETVTSGQILIGDRVVNDLVPGKRGISMVFQNYALYPHMKVRGNLSFSLRLKRQPKEQIEEATKSVSGTLEIGELLERLPKQLSGGQAQRVAVGRALIKQPQVFLFDEPLSNLDAKLRAVMRVRLTDLHEQLRKDGHPATVVYVTHDQVEAMTMGDRICVMKDGHIMQVADPLTLYEHPANAFVAGFIGMPEMNLFSVDIKRSSDHIAATLNGKTIRLRDGLAERVSAENGLVTLGVRPQHLEIVRPDTSESFEGFITNLEYMGHEVNIYVTAGEAKLVAVVPTEKFDRTLERGMNVGLLITGLRVHLFDDITGDSLSLENNSSNH